MPTLGPLGIPWQHEEPPVIEKNSSLFQNWLVTCKDFPCHTQMNLIGCNVVTPVHVTAHKTNQRRRKTTPIKRRNSPTCCGPVLGPGMGMPWVLRREAALDGPWQAKLGSSAWQGIQHGKQGGADKLGPRGRPRSVLAPPRPQQGPLYLPTPCSCHLGPTYYTGTCFCCHTHTLASHSLFSYNETSWHLVSLTI